MLITSFLKSFLIYLWYLKKTVYDHDSLISKPCSLENINFQLINNQETSNLIIPYQNFPLFIARPDYNFAHGCASGDSSSISTIFWTRITPKHKVAKASLIPVYFQLSTDASFQRLLVSGITYTNSLIDFTIKLHIRNLQPNTVYYYKFYNEKNDTIVGQSRTLPIGFEDLDLTITDSTKVPTKSNSTFILQLNDYKSKFFTRLRDYRSRYSYEKRYPNTTVLYGSNPVMYHDAHFKLDDYSRALLEWFPMKPPKLKVNGKVFKLGESLHIGSDFHQRVEKIGEEDEKDDGQSYTELSYSIEHRSRLQLKQSSNITTFDLKDYDYVLSLKIDSNGFTASKF